MEPGQSEIQIEPRELEKNTKRFRLKIGSLRFPNIKNLFVSHKKLSIFLAILLLIIIFIVFSIFRVYRQSMKFYLSSLILKDAVVSQDIPKIRDSLEKVKKEQEGLKNAYGLVLWVKLVPYVGGFVSDGQHAIDGIGYALETANLAVDAFEPYSDILGFSTEVNQEAKDGEKTAQERLDFIVGSLPEIIPKVDGISQALSKARSEFDNIVPARYPKNLFGKDVQEPIKKGLAAVDEADDFLKRAKPLLAVSPYLLGNDQKRTYLVLFQNDKELRPTGGFLTAYSIAEVEKGKFNPVNSSDIYSLDNKYRPSIPASKPILNYIKGPYQLNKNYRLRDMNWSPDFKESIELFLNESQKVGIDNIDGVIAVDTHLLVNILNVLGPIGVPGYGNFSTNIEPKCSCPQVIYELESFADVEGPVVWDPLDPTKIIYAPANYDNRKKIIGPLMNSILSNALAQQKEKIPSLFEAVYKSIIEKHVLLYIHNDKAQKAAEIFGIAGRLTDTTDDYLYINDANLGGRKSNLYLTEDVRQTIKINKDKSVEKTLEITYKNTQGYDGWLNSVLPNWTRIYIPRGSEIVDVSGLEDKDEPYEEFGKTVVAGGFQLRPLGLNKVSVTYKLPFKVGSDYKLLIQKQPGVGSPLYTLEINGKEEEFFLTADMQVVR